MPTTTSAMQQSTFTPFNEGHLPVGDQHHLYFAEYGQPDAPAAVVLHGGPGSCCKPSMLDWFDLSRQRVILFDQRGAGRSLPPGLLAHNTTAELVQDIERLRLQLQIGQWLVVGGSWGATLALSYAGRYPHALSGLVLRGVFLASIRETDWFFQSLRALAPHAWERLTAGWSTTQKNHVLSSLTHLLHAGTPEQQQEAAWRWACYEEGVMQAMMGLPESSTGDFSSTLLAKFRLQSHYLSQGCFVSERALFRCAHKAARVPTIILHGSHDWICPPENALRLQKFMPQAELRWINKGTHVAADPAIAAALRQAIRDLGPSMRV
jgi:proline iminopeptidase